MSTSTGAQFPHYGMVPKSLDANLAWRREMLEMAGRDPSVAKTLWKMCSEDLLFYCNAFCFTFDPKTNPRIPKVPFITYGFQDEALETIQNCIIDGEDFAIPKSREMGASWMGVLVFEWFWHFQPDLSFLFISRTANYVDDSGNPKSLFWKADFLHKNQPRWLLPTYRHLGSKDPNRRLMHLGNFDNGSVIDGESTTGEAGRGDRRTAMFIDEHAAFEMSDGFRVLRATRDTTNCRGFNSTPQGANNAFYEVVHKTNARIIRLHWSEHPVKSQGLYTTDAVTGRVKLLDDWKGAVRLRAKGHKRRDVVMYPEMYPFVLDGRVRSPWYDAQCARCTTIQEIGQELDIDFLGSDYQFFDPETIKILKEKHCRTPMLVGDLEYDVDTCKPKRFTENPKGKMELWLTLDADGRIPEDRAFAMGADVSAGTGASNSVVAVVDRATGEKVGVWRDSNTRPNPFAKLTIALAEFFNRAFLCWDASGPTGETFTKRVIALGYGNVYYRRREKKVGRNLTDEPGYYLNPTAKTALFEDYRETLAEHRYINRSERGMDECLQFIRRQDGTIEHSAAINTQDPSGARTAHGDEVVADALAALCMSDQERVGKPEEPDVPVGCLAWRREQKKLQMVVNDGLGEGW